MNRLSYGLQQLSMGLSGGNRPPLWSPASLSGLAVSYRPGPTWCFTDAGATTPCADGDLIYTVVPSVAGLGLPNAVQATSGLRPTLRLNGGRWWFEFPGTRKMLAIAISGAGGSAWTWACGCTITSNASTDWRLLQGAGAGTSGPNLDVLPGGGDPMIMYRGTLLNTAVAYSTAAQVLVARFPASGTGVLRRNGVQIGTGAVGTDGFTSLSVGADPGVDYYSGLMGPIVGVAADVAGSDLANLESYLAGLTGVTL